MREITAQAITDTVARLCIEANHHLPKDVEESIHHARQTETWPIAHQILGEISDNMEIAKQGVYPLCQDTGMACVFISLGQEVHITGGGLQQAVHNGVRKGYGEGYLRKSVVSDPLRRVNTKDNTPALIHVDVTEGDRFCITVAPKGFGSENMSRLAMLKPSDGLEGVKHFILETVRLAGPNPCPPMVLGVGIGGSFDQVALLAKKALLRPFDIPHPDSFYQKLEQELLEDINAVGIGPQGFGGQTTALKVQIETMPTHIAGLPVAVNVSCHVTRRAQAEL